MMTSAMSAGYAQPRLVKTSPYNVRSAQQFGVRTKEEIKEDIRSNNLVMTILTNMAKSAQSSLRSFRARRALGKALNTSSNLNQELSKTRRNRH